MPFLGRVDIDHGGGGAIGAGGRGGIGVEALRRIGEWTHRWLFLFVALNGDCGGGRRGGGGGDGDEEGGEEEWFHRSWMYEC